MLTEKIQKKNKDLVFVYTTCADKEQAKSIAYEVIGERLAASADFWPISSIYPWQSVIQDVEQYMLVVTTQKELAQRLMKYIESVHTYAVPVITECDISVSTQAYRFWIDETLENSKSFITQEQAAVADKADQEDQEFHLEQLK